MKILHILSQYPDSTGSGIYLQAILREAHKRGHINALAAAMNKKRTPQIPPLAVDNFSLVVFGCSPLDFALPGMSDVMPYSSTIFKDLNEHHLDSYEQVFIEHIAQLIEDFSPDIIHSHHLWLLSSLIKKHYPQIPLVTSCHGSDLRQFRLCPHLRDRVLEGCRNINKILALTASQKEEIIDLYDIPANTIEIVGAGFENTLFYLSPKPAAPPIQITYCGKLSRAKGVPWLLKALAQSTIQNYELHLIGEGSGTEKDECIALAKPLGPKVKFHGNLRQEALAAQLRKTHIFILPSLYEGLPLTVLEALACGCMVITTKLPGCIEIFDNVCCDMIHLIDLPRRIKTDVPHQQDEMAFINNIRHTFENVCQHIMLNPRIDDNQLLSQIRQYTWEMVFSRIEKCYMDI